MECKTIHAHPKCEPPRNKQLPAVNWGKLILAAGGVSALVSGAFLFGYSSSQSTEVKYTSGAQEPAKPCICTQEDTPAERRDKLRGDVRKLRELRSTVERAMLELEILSADIRGKLDALEAGEVDDSLEGEKSPADTN
ncbi:hypothetical protein JW721_00260 [Candidatus Micrarchaeota archaeon]|nr:hypothetical protein [Candidatus Micrarchaeota archaeon]